MDMSDTPKPLPPRTLPRPWWVEMTTVDFENLPPDTVAVLPVAAIEQHGPHLPVYVDACINAGVVERTVARLPAGLPVTFLPMQAVGKSNEHIAFPGTLTFSAETLIRMWTELGECVHRAGIRRLVLLNSHGGQPQVMDIVARDLRVRLGMFVVCTAAYFGGAKGLFPAAELAHGIHGGSGETSEMLALRPDLVRMELAQNFEPASVQMEADYKFLRPEGSKVGFGWQTQDLNPAGACGNALDADAERGNRILDHSADSLVQLLAEVHRYPMSNLRTRGAALAV
jgi:creatinine amidohydrolase